jgi:hypothetical protein
MNAIKPLYRLMLGTAFVCSLLAVRGPGWTGEGHKR